MAITAEQAVEATKNSGGIISVIAGRLGVTRQYIYKLQKKYKTFEAAIHEAREANLDLAESKLLSKIQAGDNTMIIFYLKTQGKKRGYIERQEISGSDGGAIKIDASISRAIEKAYGNGDSSS